MVSEWILPTELISQIIGYTSARDVVRWRTVSLPPPLLTYLQAQVPFWIVYFLSLNVSKRFRAITYQLNIWKVLCANVPFMPPPGLLPVRSLDRALVKSGRLAQSWSCHEMQQLRVLSIRMIHFDGDIQSDRCNHLIDGRWFIACQSKRRIVLYDTFDTHSIIGKTHAAPPTVLWEQNDQIVRWIGSPGAYREGQWVVYVWVQSAPTMQCSLLELGWDADSGSSRDTIALDVPCDPVSTSDGLCDYKLNLLFRALSTVTPCFKRSRFLYLPGQRLVFDTTTRIFYMIPPTRLALNQTRSSIRAATQEPPNIKLTNTHVIFLHHYSGEDSEATRKFIVAQAFTIPDDQRPVKMDRKDVLRLTHEGVFESRDKLLDVIRNSVVDSLTGTVHVRLLERSRWDRAADDLFCVDLTLHQPSATDVLPMTITRQSVDIESCFPVKGTTINDKYWDISDEGYARCLSRAKYYDKLCREKRVVAKLAIDATGDRCVAVYGGELEEGPHSPHNELCKLLTEHRLCVPTLDGTRGRIYDVRGCDQDRYMFVVDVE